MYFFTADEHYGHKNIIKYCIRPFSDIDAMNDEIIYRHNYLVSNKDTTIHAGDFTLGDKKYAKAIISKLNGTHIFLMGSHDYWLKNSKYQYILERKIEKYHIVVCHYAMRVWPRSHYNSFQLYGHSHAKLNPIGKQWDIGVDNNNFFPISFTRIVEIMNGLPNNFNYIEKTNNAKN